MEARFVEFEGADGDVRVNTSSVQWIQKGDEGPNGRSRSNYVWSRSFVGREGHG